MELLQQYYEEKFADIAKIVPFSELGTGNKHDYEKSVGFAAWKFGKALEYLGQSARAFFGTTMEMDNCLTRANKYLSASPEQKAAMEKERRKQFGLKD